MRDQEGRQHWMLYEGGRAPRPGDHTARFESLGLALPEKRLTTSELMQSTAHHPDIDLERLTGIR